MENKSSCVISTILLAAGILLLMAAAFDVLPIADNLAIFLALACFITNAAIKKISKGGGGCCK